MRFNAREVEQVLVRVDDERADEHAVEGIAVQEAEATLELAELAKIPALEGS